MYKTEKDLISGLRDLFMKKIQFRFENDYLWFWNLFSQYAKSHAKREVFNFGFSDGQTV